MPLRLVWEDQKCLQRTGLLATVPAAFVLGHEDHWPLIQSIPDNSAGLQRCVHAGFFQNNGAGMLWNGEVQDIWTSSISSAQEFLSLLEVTIVCWLLSREIPLQGCYLEQPCKGQFHYDDDCKGLVSTKVNGHFLICLVVGKELAGWG